MATVPLPLGSPCQARRTYLPGWSVLLYMKLCCEGPAKAEEVPFCLLLNLYQLPAPAIILQDLPIFQSLHHTSISNGPGSLCNLTDFVF